MKNRPRDGGRHPFEFRAGICGVPARNLTSWRPSNHESEERIVGEDGAADCRRAGAISPRWKRPYSSGPGRRAATSAARTSISRSWASRSTGERWGQIYDALDDLLLPYRFSLIVFDGTPILPSPPNIGASRRSFVRAQACSWRDGAALTVADRLRLPAFTSGEGAALAALKSLLLHQPSPARSPKLATRRARPHVPLEVPP